MRSSDSMDETVCRVCQTKIVGSSKRAIDAHRRICHSILSTRQSARTEDDDRVLGEIIQLQSAGHSAAGLHGSSQEDRHCHAQSGTLTNSGAASLPHFAECQPDDPSDGAKPYRDGGETSYADEATEEPGAWGRYDDRHTGSGDADHESVDDHRDGAPGQEAPSYVDEQLKEADVVAWMCMGMSNALKEKAMLALRLLAVLSGYGLEANPLHRCGLHTVEALNRFLDAKAEKFCCQMEAREVPIKSEHPELRQLAPVPLFIRPLADVLKCCFDNPDIDNSSIQLDPVDIVSDDPGFAEAGRVNNFMQGSVIKDAKQVHRSGHLLA